ncbi:Serine/threonine-protein kinase B-raf [Rhizoctonia solani]|uniref:Serine/threonine-protein kinase B-raf n=1 Tax=Rhizoctonia solani TaxID=456999 RepID=A0A0K6G476_9AGAM|nr:Serine/threonine-protein kinase B-raf [Rhizoctonia solani]
MQPHMRRYEIYQPPSFVTRAPPRYYNFHLLSQSAKERVRREWAQACFPMMAGSEFSGVGSGVASGSARSSLLVQRPSMFPVAQFGSAGMATLETIAPLYSSSLDSMNALSAGPAANHRLLIRLKRPPANPHTSMQPIPADDSMDGTDPFGGIWHHSSPYDAGEMVVGHRRRNSTIPDSGRSTTGPSKKGPSPLSRSTSESAINLTDEPPLPDPPGSTELLSGTRSKRKPSKRRWTSASRGGLASLFTRKSSVDEDHPDGGLSGLRGRSRPPLSASIQSLVPNQGIAFPTATEKRPRRKLSKRARSRSSSAASVDSSRSIETPIHTQFAREPARDVEILELPPNKPQPRPPSFQHHRPPSSHGHSAPDPPLSVPPVSRGPAPPLVTTNKPQRGRKLSAASFNSFLSGTTSRDRDKDYPRSESVQDLNHASKDNDKPGNVITRFVRRLVDVVGNPEHNSSRSLFTVEHRPPISRSSAVLTSTTSVDAIQGDDDAETDRPREGRHHKSESTPESKRRKARDEAKEQRARQRAQCAEWERQQRKRLEQVERGQQERECARQEWLERLEREREQERLEQEQLEQERREQAERERIRVAQRQREEQERMEQIVRERDRERVEMQRLELERERIERERADMARLEWERLERERLMEVEMRRRGPPPLAPTNSGRRNRPDVGERKIPVMSPKESRKSRRRTLDDSRSTSPTSTVPPKASLSLSSPLLGVSIESPAIGRTMETSEIVARLADHGCQDVTALLDVSTASTWPISRGGFGDIYTARLHDSTKVAIKTTRMYVNSSTEGTTHLKHAAQELHTWAKCNHPHVLKLLGLAIFRDQIGMISPWMKNGSLPAYLSKTPDINRYMISVQVSEGLAYLHANGIVHGDLKGMNILVSDEGAPVLTDFGNAVVSKRSLQFTTTTTKYCVSLRWTAPELLDSDQKSTCSREADIYALGMTILEIMTGQVPYSEMSEKQVIFCVYQGKLPDRPQVMAAGDAQADIVWSLLLSCWLNNPKERPTAAYISETMKHDLLGM